MEARLVTRGSDNANEVTQSAALRAVVTAGIEGAYAFAARTQLLTSCCIGLRRSPRRASSDLGFFDLRALVGQIGLRSRAGHRQGTPRAVGHGRALRSTITIQTRQGSELRLPFTVGSLMETVLAFGRRRGSLPQNRSITTDNVAGLDGEAAPSYSVANGKTQSSRHRYRCPLQESK